MAKSFDCFDFSTTYIIIQNICKIIQKRTFTLKECLIFLLQLKDWENLIYKPTKMNLVIKMEGTELKSEIGSPHSNSTFKLRKIPTLPTELYKKF